MYRVHKKRIFFWTLAFVFCIFLLQHLTYQSNKDDFMRSSVKKIVDDFNRTLQSGHRTLENYQASQNIDTVHNKTQVIEELMQSLRSKLLMANQKNVIKNITNRCDMMGIEYNDTCDSARERICPQRKLPEDLKTRLEQLVLRENLEISPEHRRAIANMSNQLQGFHDIIIVSGLSSNHYREAQALMKHVHEELFPVLKNFTFVMYNLGLTDTEASQVRKFCRCQFLTFPFDLFPPHVRTLKCFGFKPAIVRALMDRANIVMWTDTSIQASAGILSVIDRARNLGIQQRYSVGHYPNPSHTLEQLFHFFGDSPCAHMAFNQVAGGFGIYHNEALVKRAILDPWLACALRSECTCPVDQRTVQTCPSAHKTKKIGLCHRNDQSSMTLILAKLFRENYYSFTVSIGGLDMHRIGRSYNYFDELMNKTVAS